MINPFYFPYKKVLAIGAGGGNDIVSATLVALYFSKHGIQADVGGALSPGAIHRYNNRLETVVNKIEGDVHRYRPSKNLRELTFVDAHLPGIAQKHQMPIKSFYNFSTRFGTQALAQGIEQLVRKEGYECIIAVDVGGDILARGFEDPYVLSPMMDFSFLKALSMLSLPTALIEFGLGTDGELRSQGISEIFEELCAKNAILYDAKISRDDTEVQHFRSLFDEVKKIRSGHTAVMTLRTLDTPTPDKDIVSDYRLSYRIENTKWNIPFQVKLPHETFGKAYAIDLKSLACHRHVTAFSYENPLEQYLRLRSVPTWKTEADLFYVWSGDSWRSPCHGDGLCLYLLATSTRTPLDTRKEIIEAGVRHMREGAADAALLYAEDARYIDPALPRHVANEFVLTSPEEHVLQAVVEQMPVAYTKEPES